MLTDEQIRKHVNTIVSQVVPKTGKDEALLEAGVALLTSLLIALHNIARK